MNKFALLCVVIAGMIASGCDTARPSEPIAGADTSKPATQTSATAGTTHHPDPAANGGSTLPASAPYSGGATVQQNVNAAPFLNSSSGGSGNAASPAPNALTSRADGTMSGPTDQPAASTGWGTSSTPAAPAPAAKPPAKKK